MNSDQITLLFVIVGFLSAIIVGVVEGLKRMGVTSPRYALPAAMVTGIIFSALVAASDLVDGFDFKDDLALVVLAGLLAGLAASGLYSGVRAVAGTG